MDNGFMFTFPSNTTLTRVFEQSPWNIKGHLLVLKQCILGAEFYDFKLHLVQLWIQVHGFPMGCVTHLLAMEARAKMGEVFTMDFCTQKKVLIGQFVQVCVLFDTLTPSITGFFFQRPGRDDVWICFKYERISDFYFPCGILGHVMIHCIMPPTERSFYNAFGSQVLAESTAYQRFLASGTPRASIARLDSRSLTSLVQPSSSIKCKFRLILISSPLCPWFNCPSRWTRTLGSIPKLLRWPPLCLGLSRIR